MIGELRSFEDTHEWYRYFYLEPLSEMQVSILKATRTSPTCSRRTYHLAAGVCIIICKTVSYPQEEHFSFKRDESPLAQHGACGYYDSRLWTQNNQKKQNLARTSKCQWAPSKWANIKLATDDTLGHWQKKKEAKMGVNSKHVDVHWDLS